MLILFCNDATHSAVSIIFGTYWTVCKRILALTTVHDFEEALLKTLSKNNI